MSIWVGSHKWLFMLMSALFLVAAFISTYRGEKKASPLGLGFLYSTAALCIGLVIYAYINY